MIKTIQILRHLQDEIVANLSYEKVERLKEITAVIYFLNEVAERNKDKEMLLLLDDMLYPVNEALMGALGKGFELLPKIENKLKDLAENYDS